MAPGGDQRRQRLIWSALLHVLESLRAAEGYQPDVLVFLQCTSPLTLAEDIDGTVEALLDAKADTALAVIPFHYFLWKPLPDGDAIGINHNKSYRPLRQGALFAVALFSFANLLGKTLYDRFFIFAFTLSMGAVQLFFGHVENYTLVTLIMMLFILVGVRYLKGVGPLYMVGLLA